MLVVASSLLVTGCRLFDYQLRVHNGTTETWLVKANPHFRLENGADAGTYYVRVIEPGAEGVPLQWYGDKNNPVELLYPDCRSAGFLESQDGESYMVPGVDGFTATVEKAVNAMPAPSDQDVWGAAIRWTSDCGGSSTGV